MRKKIGLLMGLSLLSIGSFTYGVACNEIQNSVEVGGECYCKEGFTWNDGKTECSKIDTTLRDSELKKAIERMYENGLTQYNTLEGFKSNDYLTREQASKFFVTFYSKILNKKLNENVNLNIFLDMDKANPDLRYYISQANDMGLFKGFKGKFFPTDKLTQAQAISVAIRMIDGNLEEIKNTRYVNYYTQAKKYGLLKYLKFDIVELDMTNITRGDTAIILYDLYKHITNYKDETVIEYNNNLTKSINKCLDTEEENISVFENGTEEEMNNAINKILNVCKESAKEIYSIGTIENDDSLQKAMLIVISHNISFYNKAKEIVPYKHLENLTETQEIESDKIGKELKNLINKFDDSLENLKNIQKDFSNEYGFGTEE